MKPLYLLALFITVAFEVCGFTTNSIATSEYNLNIGDDGTVLIKCGSDTVAYNATPVCVTYKIVSAEGAVTVKQAYDTACIVSDSVIVAHSTVNTICDNKFRVTDVYSVAPDVRGMFLMNRTVEPFGSNDCDGSLGFRSSFSFGTRGKKAQECEYFIPSIIYRDTTAMRPGSIASTFNDSVMYVKETRAGLPLVMLRDKDSGYTVSLLHYNPSISTGNIPGGGTDGSVSNEFRYGSIGYGFGDAVSVVFNYPCIEGPVTYERLKKNDTGRYYTGRFHDSQGCPDHSYTIGIIVDCFYDYNKAMTETFCQAYTAENPVIHDVNMDDVYEQNIELLNAEWRQMGTGKVKASGLPWSLDLPDGKNTEGVSFQMGFVGQQIAVGYHLYRYGITRSLPEIERRGKAIIDFWTSETVASTYFPTVWWDPADTPEGGRRREYPSFLRCMTDGMEGLLDACRYSDAIGCPNPQWKATLDTVVSHIVESQNSDGSFFRAYRTDGTVETGGDRNTFGESRLNTPVPVRLLVNMYRYTGDGKYREAALKAAKFSYDHLYKGKGKYVGGTPDNPNTVDKEAAIFALYCFNAVHDLTGDSLFLKAAEHAAVNAMSWVYINDFSIPDRDERDIRINPFSSGGISGFSIISTGHSGADNFIAYIPYEMYRLYMKTGKPIYRYMALFVQNNSKRCTDYDGRMGYKYRAFMPEATNVADLAFRSVSLWLPWSSIANIEPLVKLYDDYGVMDIAKVPATIAIP